MKRISSVLLSFVLVCALALPVFAQAASVLATPKAWRITMQAYVLETRADQIIVWLTNPEKAYSVLEGVKAINRHSIPVNRETEFLDSSGNLLTQEQILPGQKVGVTFRYISAPGDDQRSAYMQPQHCYMVKLREETIPISSEMTWENLPPQTAYGVITRIDDDGGQLELSGLSPTYTLEDSVYWIGQGEYGEAAGLSIDGVCTRRLIHADRVSIGEKTKIYDTMGRRITFSDLQLFQRIRVSGPIFYAGFNGVYLDNAQTIRVLEPGEAVFAPQLLTDFKSIPCTVVENRGGVELLVRPNSNTWLGLEAELWRIPLAVDFLEPTKTPRFPYKPGDWISIERITHISEGASPGILSTYVGGVQLLEAG